MTATATPAAPSWFRPALIALLVLLAGRFTLSVASNRGQQADFPVYYQTGVRAAHGAWENLYEPRHRFSAQGNELPPMRYAGPPITSLLWAPIGLFEERTALTVFKAMCALSLAAGLAVLLRGGGPGGAALGPRATIALLAIALVFEPLWFVFPVGGQATAIAFLPLALFAVAAARGREVAAAGWLLFVIMLKPFIVPVGLVLLVARRWRLLAAMAGWGACVVLVSMALMGWDTHRHWLESLQRTAGHWNVPWHNNVSLPGAAANFWSYLQGVPFRTPGAPPVFMLFCRILLASVVAATVWLAESARRRLEDRPYWPSVVAAMAITLPFFVSRVIWPHYLTFLLVPLAMLLPLWPRLGAMTRTVIAIGVAVSALRVCPYFLDWAGDHAPDTLVTVLLAGLAGAAPVILLGALVALDQRGILDAIAGAPATPAGSGSREPTPLTP